MKRFRLRPGLLTDSWELKLTALGLSLLLWAAVRSEDTTRFTMRDVPVQVRLTDDDWVSAGTTEPRTVTVDFRGPVRELVRLAFAEATLVVPIEDVEDTVEMYRPQPEWIEYDGRFESLRVDEIQPSVLRLVFEPVVRRDVPVAIRLAEEIKATTRLAGPPAATPASVFVEGPRSRVQAIDSVIARVSDVEAALRQGSVRVALDTAGLDVTVVPAVVRVELRALPDSALRPGPDSALRALRAGALLP